MGGKQSRERRKLAVDTAIGFSRSKSLEHIIKTLSIISDFDNRQMRIFNDYAGLKMEFHE